MFNDEVSFGGRFGFGIFACRGAHLTALFGIGLGFLPCGVQKANALHGHVQAGGVHHDKHGVQPFAGLANDLCQCIVKTHDASGAAVESHFFFNAIAMHSTAFAIGIKLGHQEQRQTFGAGWGIGQAGQHQMHNVVGEVVLATRDENLRAIQGVATISLWRGLGARQAQVTACMRLGQAHGGEPFAGANFAEVGFLERGAGVVFDALIGAM